MNVTEALRELGVAYAEGGSHREEKLLDVLQRKQKVLDQTLDGRGGAGGFDVFDQLTQLLAEEGR